MILLLLQWDTRKREWTVENPGGLPVVPNSTSIKQKQGDRCGEQGALFLTIATHIRQNENLKGYAFSHYWPYEVDNDDYDTIWVLLSLTTVTVCQCGGVKQENGQLEKNIN